VCSEIEPDTQLNHTRIAGGRDCSKTGDRTNIPGCERAGHRTSCRMSIENVCTCPGENLAGRSREGANVSGPDRPKFGPLTEVWLPAPYFPQKLPSATPPMWATPTSVICYLNS